MLQDIIFIAIILILFYISIRIGILDIWGSILSLFLGIFVYYFGGPEYLILLISFVAVSYLATVYKSKYKRDIYGMSTKRMAGSVISKGIIPFILIIIPFLPQVRFYLFSASVAVATADTVSGEIGIFSENTYTPIGFKRTKPGEEGAVSILGEISALVSSSTIALIYFIFSKNLIYSFFVIIIGFVGANIDSILGATLEKRGIIGKHAVNILAIIISIIFAYTLI
ncbi:MAG: DUF92 domain-containing protein [Euryarchaeota archaeon]|nr:DUF92 domain-containing protein [Euryarchaeota archaeon]